MFDIFSSLQTMSCRVAFWPPFFIFMSNEEIKQKILELAEPLVKENGLEIWGVQIIGSPPKNVRLFVDVPEAGSQGGMTSATIEQCEDISRQLGLAIEVEDIMPVAWNLEVSSPGLERRFFSLKQLVRYKGDLLEVSLYKPLAETGGKFSRALWKGRLLGVGEDCFTLEPCQISGDGEIMSENLPPCVIPWSDCKAVKRLFVYQPPKKPGKVRLRKS